MRRQHVPLAYQAALDYLYSFINYETKPPPSREHARFNLDRMRFLLAELGDPQTCFPGVVVAGTKGKGSTCALLEALLRAAGYRTGLFSSPHLHSWRERIQVDRVLITQDEVVAAVERLKPIVPQLEGRPTVFELATAIALRYFADRGIDIAVLEVGMGGRYDTVNVVTPLVSVITPISYDHMAVLGNTLEEIAYAKAGIIKPRVPVVTTWQEPEVDAVIRAEAQTQGAPLWYARDDGLTCMEGQTQINTVPYPIPFDPERIALGGVHQLINARVAVGAALLLRKHDVAVSDAAMLEGLRNVDWPGRFEVIAREPLVVVDGAMNGASARRLREALATLPHRRRILVLGTSRDKDIAAIARELVPEASAVVLTRSYHPRSADVELLAEHVQPLLPPECPLLLTDDIPPALEEARRLAGPDDLICVAGSLYVVAAAREALGVATEID